MKQEPQTEKKKRKERRRVSDILSYLVLVVAVIVFFYAAFQLFCIFREYKKGSDEYKALREYVQVVDQEEEGKEKTGSEDPVSANEFPQCPISVDFASLKNINADIVGWLYIEAVPSISYPLVQGTDNEYYLKHTVEGIENTSASIFMDYRNRADLSDSNTVIYGHNMKNQSMFGILSKLKEQEVYDKSPYIWIITENGEICYEIFSARNVPDTDDLYHTFQVDASSFKSILEGYQRYSEIETDIVFDGTEKIITLSTCTGNDRIRCVVQAVRRDF